MKIMLITPHIKRDIPTGNIRVWFDGWCAVFKKVIVKKCQHCLNSEIKDGE
jgi:hypothetical protein